MKYVSVFYEGEHNDARTNLCIAFTAAMYGAAISNYAKVAETAPILVGGLEHFLFFHMLGIIIPTD